MGQREGISLLVFIGFNMGTINLTITVTNSFFAKFWKVLRDHLADNLILKLYGLEVG